MLKLGVLISGRGSNMAAIADNIESGQLLAKIEVVISNIEGAGGIELAKNRGLNTQVIPHNDYPSRDEFETALVSALQHYDLDLIVLAGFMRVIGPNLLAPYKGKIINMHPSILPAFNGLNAQKQALEYGCKVAGCTVHFVDEELDTGPIIGQATVRVKETDTQDSLSARILLEEHRLFSDAIQMIADGRVSVSGRRVHIRKEI
ncbi:MAG: phosphoribosylglycinamide formyltransferase [bacterium]|nr:phosphoribosylglycinamide formyltransferase [bacterium]